MTTLQVDTAHLAVELPRGDIEALTGEAAAVDGGITLNAFVSGVLHSLADAIRAEDAADLALIKQRMASGSKVYTHDEMLARLAELQQAA